MSTPGTKEQEITRTVRERYARAAGGEADCCGSSCCGGEGGTSAVSRAIGYSEADLAELPDGADLGLGCGNPTAIAALVPGEVVLDLGSGAGIDCFLASRQVGPTGRVIGVDMTPEMLERARANADRGGFDNVEFRLGEIEALPVADGTVDVVLSNCVLNLVPDKARALREVQRVLRPGGRLAISDMVSDVDPPDALKGDLDALAACLPIQRDVYLEQIRAAGFADVRIADERRYPAEHMLGDPGVRNVLAERPELTGEIDRFARGVFGAHFEGVRR
ncbi:MAG: arsenite methyltransferase [Gemmatimonadota bacterium]